MDKNRKIIFGLVAVAVFIAVVYLLPTMLTLAIPQDCTINGRCLHEEELNLFTKISPAFVIAGFVIGALAFFFFAETKKIERVEIKPEKENVLTLLEKDERKVVSRIVEEGGRVLQSEISHIEGIGKVKAHRVLERLEKRGVVEKEAHGKTNLVKISRNLKGLF
ncbi:hypothetical protein HY992_06115 [Candidatus Micrarchaeota archaeon]|nr:hypothetical protein [Candidatus Micrarchaeota archaeon]